MTTTKNRMVQDYGRAEREFLRGDYKAAVGYAQNGLRKYGDNAEYEAMFNRILLHALNVSLLQQIEVADEATRGPLLVQANQLGLEFDTNLQPLENWKPTDQTIDTLDPIPVEEIAANDRQPVIRTDGPAVEDTSTSLYIDDFASAPNDNQARELIRLAQAGPLDKANELLAQASGLADLSREAQEEIAQASAELSQKIELEHQLLEALPEIENGHYQKVFTVSQQVVKQSQELNWADGVQRAGRIMTQSKIALDELATVSEAINWVEVQIAESSLEQLALLADRLEQTKRVAERLKQTDLLEQIMLVSQSLNARRSELDEIAHQVQQQAVEALHSGDRLALKQALENEALGAHAAEIQADQQALDDLLIESSKLRQVWSETAIWQEPYIAQTVFSTFLAKLEQAVATSARDQETALLRGHLKIVDEAIAFQARIATEEEPTSPYATPKDLNEALKKLNIDLDEYQRSGKSDAAARTGNLLVAREEAFKRAAVKKLRKYIEKHCLDLQVSQHFMTHWTEDGKAFDYSFEAVLRNYTTALEMWNGFYENFKLDSAALHNRLRITQQQKTDLENTQGPARQILLQLDQADGEGAQNTPDWENALKNYQAADALLGGLKPAGQYALRGLRLRLSTNWSRICLKYGSQLAHDAYARAQAAFADVTRSGAIGTNIGPAEEKMSQALAQVGRVNELAGVYRKLIGGDDWSVPDYAAAINDLSVTVRQSVDDLQNLTHGDDALFDGQYADAEGFYQQIRPNSSKYSTAQTRLTRLANIKSRQVAAVTAWEAGDIKVAYDELNRLMLDEPRSRYISAQLQKLTPLLASWQETRKRVSQAIHYFERKPPNYERALQELDRVKEEYLTPSERIFRNQIEQARENQVYVSGLRTEIAKIWSGELTKANYEELHDKLNELLELLPNDNQAIRWQSRLRSAEQVFSACENSSQEDQLLLDQLQNLPDLDDRASAYSQALQSSLNDRINRKRSRQELEARLTHARQNQDWQTVLDTATFILNDPARFQAQTQAAQARQEATEALRNLILEIIAEVEKGQIDRIQEAESAAARLAAAWSKTDFLTQDLQGRVRRASQLTIAIRQLNELPDQAKTAAEEAQRIYRGEQTDTIALNLIDRANMRLAMIEADKKLRARDFEHAYQQLLMARTSITKLAALDSVEQELQHRISNWLPQAQRNAAIQLARRLGGQGDFDGAHQAFVGLPDNVAVTAEIENLRQQQELLDKARRLEGSDLSLALDALNESLKLNSDLRPAEVSRNALLKRILERAIHLCERLEKLDLKKQVDLSTLRDMLEAKRLADLAYQHEPNVNTSDLARNASSFTAVWRRNLDSMVNHALDGADAANVHKEQLLFLAEQLNLGSQNGLLSARAIDQEKDLRARAGNLEAINVLVARANAEIESTLTTGTGNFQEARHTAEAARNLNAMVFGQRAEINDLFTRLIQHERTAKELKSLNQQLAEERQRFKSTFNETQLSNVYLQSQQALEHIALMIKSIRALDPENKYHLRSWPSSSLSDPHLDELNQVEAQRKELEEAKAETQVVAAIAKKVEQLTAEGNEAQKRRSNEAMIESEIATWKELEYQLAQQSQCYERIAGIAALTPAAALYKAQANRNLEKLNNSRALNQAKQWRVEAESLLQQLMALRPTAQANFVAATNDPRYLDIALGSYVSIQTLNGLDSEAAQRIPLLQRRLKDYSSAQRQKRLWLGITITALAFIGLAGLIGCQNNVCNNVLFPPTATPTLLPTLPPTVTPLPTATVTLTATATNTVTPTAIPPTTEPPVLGCSLPIGAYIKEKPDPESKTIGRLLADSHVTVIDVTTNPNNNLEYWRVDDGQGNVGWLDPSLVTKQCALSSTPTTP